MEDNVFNGGLVTVKLMITDKNDKKNTYDVNDCKLLVYEEEFSWRLKIITGKCEISYLIHQDTRETFAAIREYIEKLREGGVMNISEDPDRSYIFISGNDEVVRQFSGQREM